MTLTHLILFYVVIALLTAYFGYTGRLTWLSIAEWLHTIVGLIVRAFTWLTACINQLIKRGSQ